MKWFLNRCRRQRQNLCLLASGVLAKQEVAENENHLAACSGCRKYYAEIKMTALPFATWENHFEQIEPRPAVQVRWAKAIESAGRRKSISTLSPKVALLECWRELIWPARRIWIGLATAWVLILAVNLNLKSGGPNMSATKSSGSADFIMALREQEQVMAELTERPEPKAVEPPRQFVPQPRSERRREFFTI